MLTKHSTQLARALEDLFPVKNLALPGIVCEGSGLEAQGEKSTDEERRKVHDGCKLRGLGLPTRNKEYSLSKENRGADSWAESNYSS